MNLALRRYKMMVNRPAFYHLTLQMITTSTPISPKGYDEYDSPNWEKIQYAITVTNDGTININNGFYVVDELTGDEWWVGQLTVGASQQFTCEHCTTQADLLAGVVINACQIDMSSELEDLWYDSDNPIEPNVPVTEDETYKPYPSVILTETSTPSNGDSYEEGETITITITVTGDSKYAIYGGSITSSFDNNTWNLGTLTNGEYVLAANAVNTFTWTHTVTATDVNNGMLEFSVIGSAEAFHEWGGGVEIEFDSNTIYIGYATNYLTFTALANGTFTLSIPAAVNTNYMTSVSYSTNNGQTWTTTNITSSAQTITTPTITTGNKVLWKGIGKQTAINETTINTSYQSRFSSSANCNVSGNAMSLLYGDDFINKTSFPNNSAHNFHTLFRDMTKLINAKNIVLPVITLTEYCYNNMFHGCSALVTIPSVLPATTLAYYCYCAMFELCTSLITVSTNLLPATVLASRCYYYMFSGCTKLTNTPALTSENLEERCYGAMFQQCTALTSVPTLPATTLKSGCYYYMFDGCKLITTAPVLPATTLVSECYEGIFRNCTKLNYIKALFTTTPTASYTKYWVQSITGSGTFIKNTLATWSVTATSNNNYIGIPSGWTVQTASS